jgi:hypothetical protein
MALTYVDLLALETVGLVALMDQARDFWYSKAKEAYDYTCKIVPAPVRPDDVVQILEPGLQVTTELRNHLAERKLREKYWYRRFGDLLLDTFWPDLLSSDQGSQP